jgi:hypothetical protein
MRSDRLLFFDDEVADAAPQDAGPDAAPNTLAAVLFLTAILLAQGAVLYLLVAWHVPRMH